MKNQLTVRQGEDHVILQVHIDGFTHEFEYGPEQARGLAGNIEQDAREIEGKCALEPAPLAARAQLRGALRFTQSNAAITRRIIKAHEYLDGTEDELPEIRWSV